jgi:hypothetical protein
MVRRRKGLESFIGSPWHHRLVSASRRIAAIRIALVGFASWPLCAFALNSG